MTAAKNGLDLSIIIVNWNVTRLLEQCLHSLVDNVKDISYEVIVIDNASTDENINYVQEKFKKFVWINNKKNIGCVAFNQALPYCNGRYLLLLGPDTVLLPNCLEPMVQFLDSRSDAGGVTANLLNPDRTLQRYYRRFPGILTIFFSTLVGREIDSKLFSNKFLGRYFYEDLDLSRTTEVEQPPGACFMIRRQAALKETNEIVHRKLPFFFNDVDICKRIYNNNYKIFLLPPAKVVHYGSASFKKREILWYRKEYCKGLLEYFRIHYRFEAKMIKLMLIFDLSISIIATFLKSILDFQKQKDKFRKKIEMLKYIICA